MTTAPAQRHLKRTPLQDAWNQVETMRTAHGKHSDEYKRAMTRYALTLLATLERKR